jgi:hypothetical protein
MSEYRVTFRTCAYKWNGEVARFARTELIPFPPSVRVAFAFGRAEAELPELVVYHVTSGEWEAIFKGNLWNDLDVARKIHIEGGWAESG